MPSERTIQRIRGSVHFTEQYSRKLGDGVFDPQSRAKFKLKRMRVKSQSANYLMCHTWDGTTEGTSDIFVAKPWKLRHVVGNYEGLTDLTTSTVSQVDVTDDTDDETWEVTPSYQVDDEIFVFSATPTGVIVAGEELKFLDANVDGRAWAVA